MVEIVNIYRKNTSNTGDKFSTPTKYFDFLKNIRTLDITELPLDEFSKEIENKIIIFGGGGFLEQDYFKDYMNVLLEAKTRLLIGWGIGHNVHGACDILYNSHKYSERFDLLGVRDSTDSFEWVPCVSCMHPIFDKTFKVKNKIVVYEHKNFPLRDIDPGFPKMKNGNDFEEVMEFLGSAELIITNSYHGAYWATLLKRKVIVMQPFSSKFFGFRHPLLVANNFNIKNIENIPVYFNALKEAREANLSFAEKVYNEILLVSCR